MTSMLRSVRRHRRGVAALVAALSGSMVGLGTTPAAAEPVLDANCPGPPNSMGNTATDARRAQTFTAQTTGSVIRGEVEINKPAMSTLGDFVMQVVAVDTFAFPTNTVLASTTIPNASVPSGNTRIAGDFAAPASVVAGERYALLITRPGGQAFLIRDRNGNPCLGQEFLSLSLDGEWILEADFDLVFSIFVEPAPGPKRDRTLSLDANKNKVKKGKRVTLTGRIAETRQAGSCVAGQTVELQRRKPSQADFTTVEQLQTDAAGAFSAKEKVKKTFDYRAQVAETATCLGRTSNTEKVKVKKK
jgi:hypothetical protein